MTLTREQIRAAALELHPNDREALAEELPLSISVEEREAIDQAWLEEARRRDAAFLAGNRNAKPVDEVLDRLKRGARP